MNEKAQPGEMGNANVGDTILVTSQKLAEVFNKMCVVVSCPDDGREIVWVRLADDDNQPIGIKFWLNHSSYSIVRRAGSEQKSTGPCPDCNGKGVIELFTSTRKCRCMS